MLTTTRFNQSPVSAAASIVAAGLTPVGVQEEFYVIDIRDINELLVDFFPDTIPEVTQEYLVDRKFRQYDEFIRQLVDYMSRDWRIYMAKMTEFIPKRYDYLAEQGVDLAPVQEAFLEAAMLMYGRIDELRLFRPGLDPMEFPYFLEQINGDSAILKFTRS